MVWSDTYDSTYKSVWKKNVKQGSKTTYRSLTLNNFYSASPHFFVITKTFSHEPQCPLCSTEQRQHYTLCGSMHSTAVHCHSFFFYTQRALKETRSRYKMQFSHTDTLLFYFTSFSTCIGVFYVYRKKVILFLE